MPNARIRGADAQHMTAAYILGVCDASKATSASEQSAVEHAKHGRRFLEPLPLSSGRERQKKRTGFELRLFQARVLAWLATVASIFHQPWTDVQATHAPRSQRSGGYLCCLKTVPSRYKDLRGMTHSWYACNHHGEGSHEPVAQCRCGNTDINTQPD